MFTYRNKDEITDRRDAVYSVTAKVLGVSFFSCSVKLIETVKAN